MRKSHAILILLTCMAFRCSDKIPKSVKEKFGKCYDGHNTGISARININGYYAQRQTSMYANIPEPSVFIHHIIFFEDGIFWSQVFDYPEGTTPSVDLTEFLQNIVNDPDGQEAALQRGSGFQGMYQIKGDTIFTRAVNYPPPPALFQFSDEKFVIVDRNSLLQINANPNRTVEKANFIQVERMPKSNSWLQTQDWFYCNPTDKPSR